jgi:hypothetical protein
LNFVVSNVSDKAFLIDAIWLEVVDVEPYCRTVFPEGPAAPIETHFYEVTLTPKQGLYLVTDDDFTYKPGEVEEFDIKVESSEMGYIYQVALKVDWYNLDKPKSRKQSTVNAYLVDFPSYYRLEELLEGAEQVDYFLRDDTSVGRFMGVRTTWYDPSILSGDTPFHNYTQTTVKRLLIPEEMQSLNLSQTPNLDVRFFLDAEDINLSRYYTVGSQYLILYGLKGTTDSGNLSLSKRSGSAIVIQHICCGEAEIVWDSEDVEQYIRYFDQLWNETSP